MANENVDLTITAKNATEAAFKAVEGSLKSLKDGTTKQAESTKGLGDEISSFLTKSIGSPMQVASKAIALVTAATAGAAAGVIALGIHGATVDDIANSFNVLNQQAGNVASVMLGTLKTATGGTISDFEIMKGLNVGLSAGLKLNAQDADTLGRSARVLADRVGGDNVAAYNALIEAMTTGKDKALQQIGVHIDLTKAVEDHAKSLGLEASELNDSQKLAANKAAILSTLSTVLKVSGNSENDFADGIDRAKVAIQNATDNFAVAIAQSPVLNAGLNAIGDAMATAFGSESSDLIKTVVHWIEEAAIVGVDLGIGAVQVGNVMVAAWSVVGTAILGVATAIAGVGTILAGFIAEVAHLAEKIPGASKYVTGFADGADRLAYAMEGVTAKTAGWTEATAKGVIGHSALNGVLDSIGGKLYQVHDAMIAAQKATDDHTETTKKVVKAINDESNAIEGLTKRQKLLADEALKAAAFNQDEWKRINDERTKLGDAHTTHWLANLKIEADADKSASDERRKRTMSDYDFQIDTIKREGEATKAGLDKTASDYDKALDAIDRDVAEKMTTARLSHEREVEKMKAEALTFQNAWMKVLGDIPSLVQQAFTGGGGIAGAMKAVSSDLGSEMMKNFFSGPSMQPIVSGVFNKLGSTVGTAFGMALPGIGAAIGAVAGPLLGKLTGALKNLFGGAGAKLNDERDSWIMQLTGINDLPKAQEAFRQLATEAGATAAQVAAVLDARKAGDFSAAQQVILDDLAKQKQSLQDLQALTDAQGQKQDLLNAAVERYGFTINELGPAMRNQKLSEQAEQLIQDFGLLTESGINVTTVTARMADSINDFVHKAIATGTEVPEAMRPMLESMITQGTLTDAAGHKITDLTSTGITFGETLTQGFKHVVDKLDELIQKLTGSFPNAIASATGTAMNQIDATTTKVHALGDAVADAVPTDTFQANMENAADGAIGSLAAINSAASIMKSSIAAPITIPIGFSISDYPDLPGPSGGNATQDDLDTFLKNNPGDEGRANRAFRNITDPNLPGYGTAPGAAAGGLFSQPTFRVIAEREPEIVGSPNVIVDALSRAMTQQSAKSPAAGGLSSSSGPMIVQVYIGADKIDEQIIGITNKGLASGAVRVPRSRIVERA